jgi:hypothetical protein
VWVAVGVSPQCTPREHGESVTCCLRLCFPLDEAADGDNHLDMIRRPLGERLGLVGFGVSAGVGASVIGAWTSSEVVGGARTEVWIGVTAVLAVVAARFADQAVVLVGRLLRTGLGRRPASR